MVSESNLIIGRETLKVSQIIDFLNNNNAKILLDNEANSKILAGLNFLEKNFDQITYGVNTGFGPMADRIIPRECIVALQENLIRSHALGLGNFLPDNYVLATMIVRLNTLAKGASAVSLELVEKLVVFINERILPVVPEHGAVGTSGDLVQLAHIALGIIGSGEASYKGKSREVSELLRELSIEPHILRPKEGLSLINGTSAMTGIGVIFSKEVERILSLATRLGAMSLELVRGYRDGISVELHAMRPHPGQIYIAKVLRELLNDSTLLRNRSSVSHEYGEMAKSEVTKIPEAVQEYYSIRCMPQILGPVYEAYVKLLNTLEIEINSVTDNPVFDASHGQFLHGGNFHGDFIAQAADQMKASIVKLTMLSERRINFFLHSKLNQIFPPFMNLGTPGLTLGLQGLQFVATSTTALSQSLAFPHHIHSIPTNGDNQDIVSMGTDAMLLALKTIEHAYIVLTIELITLGQGVEYLGIQSKLSNNSARLYELLRKEISPIIEDKLTHKEITSVTNSLKNTPLLNNFY